MRLIDDKTATALNEWKVIAVIDTENTALHSH